MLLSRNGIETKVWIVPYEESSIDKGTFIQTTGEPIMIKSVPNYEKKLVEIALPNGDSIVASAEQIMTAIQKCRL